MKNVNMMLKAEMLDRFNYRCEHRHNGFNHPACYAKDRGEGERIGFLDIESGGSLDADWGFTFTYCIKKLDSEIIGSCITPAEVRKPLMEGGTKDKRLLEKFCKDIRKFDTIVVYYGKDTGFRGQRHDIPFLRTRCAKWGLDFPTWKQLKVIDLYDIVKKYFKLSRRRMVDACRLLGIECKASPFNQEIWQDALTGYKPALDYIMEHNRQDVISTEKLFKAVIKYRETRTNI